MALDTGSHKMPGRKGRFAALCGMVMLLSAFVVMFSLFIAAYTSPSGAAVIHVNMFQEAPVELALLLFTMVLGSYAFVTLFRDFRHAGVSARSENQSA